MWKDGWHDVVIEVDWQAKLARLEIDGTVTESVTSSLGFLPGALYVELGGTGFNNAADPKRIVFDDLVVRAR